MATRPSNRIIHLGHLVTEVSVQVRIYKVPPEQAVAQVVGSVPKEKLGALILEADSFISPFTVKSRIGFTERYPQSWEKYLRETLESVVTGILSLDYAK